MTVLSHNVFFSKITFRALFALFLCLLNLKTGSRSRQNTRSDWNQIQNPGDNNSPKNSSANSKSTSFTYDQRSMYVHDMSWFCLGKKSMHANFRLDNFISQIFCHVVTANDKKEPSLSREGRVRDKKIDAFFNSHFIMFTRYGIFNVKFTFYCGN